MDRIKNSTLSLLLVFSLMACAVGVINTDTAYAASKKIHLKKTTITLVSGKTFQQKLIDRNGNTIKATKIKWKSSKKSVATITKKGKIKALKAGTAKLTAKYKGKTYKFTVKVKKPFKSGQKPKITDLSDYSDSIYVEWSTLSNAKYYQVYVSVNGYGYELYEKTDDTACYYEDVAAGNSYSFKVRGIAGKYKSAFSKAETITIDDDSQAANTAYSNTSITSDSSEVVLILGETQTVTITTDKGSDVSFNCSNNNVYASWGSWDGNSIPLTIGSNALGESTVTVYDNYNNSVQCTIKVYVFSGLELLYNFVNSEGYTNGNGDKTLSYTIDSDNIVFFINHSNSVEFLMFNTYNTSDFDSATKVSMLMELPQTYAAEPTIRVEINDYYFTAHSSVNTASYNDASSLYFVKDSSNTPSSVSIQDLCNTAFRQAMNEWQIALKYYTGYDLSYMGFTNY